MIMGKRTYDKVIGLLNKFKKGDKVGLMALQVLIMREVGSDPRTIAMTIRLMLDTKLIKDIGNSHFKILKWK